MLTREERAYLIQLIREDATEAASPRRSGKTGKPPREPAVNDQPQARPTHAPLRKTN